MNLYEILHVSPSAPEEIIKLAYKGLAQKYHPDRYKGTDANQKMVEIREAYEVLIDPVTRKKYDIFLKEQEYNKQKKENFDKESKYKPSPRSDSPLNKKTKYKLKSLFIGIGGIIVLGTFFLIFNIQPNFAKESKSSSYLAKKEASKNCEIPLNSINVGSIKLMQNFNEFQGIHPDSIIKNTDISLLGDRLDSKFTETGVVSVNSLDYDPISDSIRGFTLSYSEGKLADYETSLEKFKSNILNNYSLLPRNGWVLSQDENEYNYKCDDYKITIRQDHAYERNALGAVVLVFSKYSYFY